MKKKPKQLEKKPATIDRLLQEAVKNNLPVETMERLLAMRKELKAEQAREAFLTAMATLQKDLPIVKATKAVKTSSGAVAYRYAPLEDIILAVKKIIADHGFSFSVKTETKEKTVKATCIVRHQLGHEEESTVEVPLGNKTQVMSDTQVTAAAITFAKRYAFCNAFGIVVKDEDDETMLRKGEEKKLSKKEILKKIEETKTIEELEKLFAKVSKYIDQETILAFAKKKKKLTIKK